jgi:dTDP-4-amino-4,6-dideoxygalactose transaminase
MPPGFLARLSESQARLGSARLRRLPTETERRRSVAHRYTSWLVDHGRTPAAEPPGVEHAFLRYPLRVRDRPRFMEAADRLGVDVGDWFVSPVHPVVDRLDRWGFRPGQTPNAETACRQLVNLPTDPWLGDGDVDRVLSLLDAHLDLIV